MSNPPPAPSRSASIVNGPPSAGIPPAVGNSAPTTPNTPTQQNLNQIVLEYLNKKGYNRTEAMLRKESADPIGFARREPPVTDLYIKAYTLLRDYVDDILDIHRPEVSRLLWPVFVHSILNLAANYQSIGCERMFKDFSSRFQPEHADELRQLSTIKTAEHLEAPIAKTYRENKYRLTMSTLAHNTLLQFLEQHEGDGGSIITMLLQTHFNIIPVDRSKLGLDRSLAAMLARNGEDFDLPFEDEGIPGHNPGSANKDRDAPTTLPRVLLGALPHDPDAMEDVRAELQDEDQVKPPSEGKISLIEELDERIKREPVEDGPSRDLVPLPPPLARDIAMEVQKIREHRDRFKIDPKTGGIGPGISVVMYTFHNTKDSINCLDFAGDLKLVAAGAAQHYIRVWSLDGTPLKALSDDPNAKPVSSHRLVGHAGPIYSVAFSPGTAAPPTADAPSTAPHYLLSASADKTIRLWSVDTWSCLVVYKGHNAPVWDVRWGPHGHYFLSCGADKSARVWATEHISPLRMLVGHDSDVECCSFHPNGSYVFTGGDKTVRMWDISSGRAVRMFTGHQGNITAVECSPNGKLVASADDQGSIILWDLEKGTRVKRMRGHAKGGIWSLSWSVESSVLVSGGADMTVRTWDVEYKSSTEKGADSTSKVDGTTSTGGVAGGAGVVGAVGTSGRQRRRENVTTPDQISAFPTKQSPVYKVMFSRANLVLAGSAYLPEQAS